MSECLDLYSAGYRGIVLRVTVTWEVDIRDGDFRKG